MVTYMQLEDEPYWNEEIITEPMQWLADNLCAYYKRPKAAVGIKGDNHHLRGAHRSRKWIYNSSYCTNRTYTVSYPVDKRGDENWLAGVDFNPGSAELMYDICGNLEIETKAGRLEEVTEWYGNVDGDRIVDGWNNVFNRPATSDSSHLWHVHLTVGREFANSMDVMRRIFEAMTGGDMTPQEHNELLNIRRELAALAEGTGSWETMGGTKISVIVPSSKEQVDALTPGALDLVALAEMVRVVVREELDKTKLGTV